MTEEMVKIKKKRHVSLTAYLILMIVANAGAVLIYIVISDAILNFIASMPTWGPMVLVIAGLFNIICAVALFRWKKWGFWGFCASASIVPVLKVITGISAVSAVGGFLGLPILFGVLHIGKENTGWSQLE
jgi:hypothetical protein